MIPGALPLSMIWYPGGSSSKGILGFQLGPWPAPGCPQMPVCRVTELCFLRSCTTCVVICQ